MGDVVVEDEARAHRVLEVEHVEGTGQLVEPIAVTARIEAEKAREDELEVQEEAAGSDADFSGEDDIPF